MPQDIGERTRRAVLQAAAGTLGLAAVGGVSAHEFGGDDEEGGPTGTNAWTSQKTHTRGTTEGAQIVGYHALGAIGSAAHDPEREAQNPHYGGITELKTHGDYAYVTFFSSGDPTPGRGMAILDISDYNRIPASASNTEQQAMLDNAELSVVSFLRNNNTAAAVMDVKLSDDGQYAFLSTQPYQALFGTIAGNTDDPTRIEGLDPMPNWEDDSFSAHPSGLVAVDVSDPANPQALGTATLEGSGSHNAYHHRINGDDYIFAINDSGNLAGAGEGMFVFRFDRSTGQLEAVNQWEYEGNAAQGAVGPGDVTGGAYIHDMEVQNDARTGTPVLYLAYWGRGLWALDASEPANLKPLGHFKMNACHFTTPAPTLVNGKRVVVASQEVSESDTHTGRIYLIDADGIFEDGVTEMGELDVWEWQNEAATDSNESTGEVTYGPYDFSLSPHNSELARHVDRDGNESFWLHQAHYGGGVRFLEIVPGDSSAQGLTGDARYTDPGEDSDGDGFSGAADRHASTSWSLTERGFSRPTYGTPKDSRMEGLNYITPFVWGTGESNGVTFASDINQGVHAVKADGVPIGGGPPVADISRAADGSVFTAGQTNQVDVSLDYTDADVLVRDRMPNGWSYSGGEGTTDGQFVEFDLVEGQTGTYFAEAPTSTGSYTFGPVQVSADDGTTWHTLADSTDTVYVVGQSTAVGTAALAVGGLTRHRETLRQSLEGFFDRLAS